MALKRKDLLFSKLMKFDLSPHEANELAKIAKSIIGKIKNGISTKDRELVLFMLDYSTNVPQLFSEHQELKRNVAKAEEELLKKSDDKTRVKAALKVFGISVKSIKQATHKKLLRDFNSLNIRTKNIEKENRPLKLSFSLNGSQYELQWFNEATRKKEIINALYQFYKTSYSGKNAIVVQLRKMNAKGLPSY